MPCEFVDPKLSNVAQGLKARRQYMTTDSQQIYTMLKVSGLVHFVTSWSKMQKISCEPLCTESL